MINKRLEKLEQRAYYKHKIPVLIISQDQGAHITLEEFESGLFPRGVSDKTVIIVDNIPQA